MKLLTSRPTPGVAIRAKNLQNPWYRCSQQQCLDLPLGGIKDKIEFEEAKKQASIWRKEPGNIEIISIESLNILIYLKKPPSELTSAIKSEMKLLMKQNEILVTFSMDDKNPEAKTLYRTEIGQNKVDFTRSHSANTLFKHHGDLYPPRIMNG